MSSTRINVSETARDLGVVIDSHLSLSAQVAAVCRSGYYQPRQLRPLVRSMSAEAEKTPVQAFISCRLDYYNSLFYRIAEGLMSFCSLSRMRLHVWCPALDITTASRHQCYRCCTSFQFHVVWISRWPHWSVRHDSILPGRRLSVGLRRRPSSAALCHIEDVRCEAFILQIWRQVFCSCRSDALEQPSN